MDALISRPDAKAAVRSLAPFTLFHLLMEIGISDATELALLASPEQVQTFVDLACWRKDQVSDIRIAEWLGLYLQLDDPDFERLIRDLDGELLGILIMAHAEVHTVIDDEGEPNPILNLIPNYESSPDGVYAIVYSDNEFATQVIRDLLARIFAVDLVLGHVILETVRWELRTSMEEAGYQARRGRLEELGFVDPEDALELYAWVDPERYVPPKEPLHRTMAPGFMLPDVYRGDEVPGRSFLERALAKLDARHPTQEKRPSEAVRFALVTVTNGAMVMEGADPANLEATRRVLGRTRGLVTIALEYLSKRSIDAAADIVESTPIRQLFRVGNSLVLGLKKQARHLIERPGVAEALTLIDESDRGLLGAPDRLLLDGLMQSRPEIVHPDAELPAPFSKLSDLEGAAIRLSVLGFKIVALFGILRLTKAVIAAHVYVDGVVPTVESIDLDTLLSTSIALAAIGHDGFRALTTNELADLIEGPLAEEGQVEATAIYQSATTVLIGEGGLDSGAVSVAHKVARDLIAKLRDELGGLDPALLRRGELDPKFLGSSLLVKT